MKRSEIWRVNLDPTLGAEIRKTRPALILSDDDLGILPLRIVVPITDWKLPFENYEWMIRLEPTALNGLSKTSAADCFQICSVSTVRLMHKMGEVNPAFLAAIEKAVATVLKLR